MDRLELLKKALAYYGLDKDYDRIFSCSIGGSPRPSNINHAITDCTEYSWIQINLTDNNFPFKKPENKDITIVHNITLDFEEPSNPALAHAIAEQFVAWLEQVFYTGMSVRLPIEDTGAGSHIVIPIEPINTKIYGGGDVVNMAVKLTIESYMREEFFNICKDHGSQMTLGAYDISRLLSAPGTYRPPSATKPDAPFLLRGYIRKYIPPFDEEEITRVPCKLLRDFIIEKTDEAFDIIKNNKSKTNGSASAQGASSQHDQSFVKWLKAWVKRNPDTRNDRSAYFHRITCAALRRMRGVESVIVDHADVIDTLAGSKYNGRAITEVQRSLIRAKQLSPSSPTIKSGQSINDYIEALEALGYSFRMNECGHDIEVNGEKMRDGLDARICNQMYDYGFPNAMIVRRVWQDLADSDSYHPVKEYLQKCKDKYIKSNTSNHIIALSSHFIANKEILDDDGDKIIYTWLRKWLIGAVAKVLRQEQNPVLVLEGPQDIGKSTFARWLAGDLINYHIEQPINLSRAENDTNIRLTQKWIWEVGELGATTRRQDVEALKDFITRKYVTVRKPYGHNDVELPALASFIGTINETGGGFLSDPTGNRRFIIAPILYIDFNYVKVDSMLVWGEAVQALESGEDFKVRGDDIKVRDRINEVYTINEPLVEIIARYFDYGSHVNGRMYASEIATYLMSKRMIRGIDKSSTIAVGTALKKLDIKRRRGADDRWFYDNIQPKSLQEQVMNSI